MKEKSRVALLIEKVFDNNLGIILAVNDLGQVVYFNEDGKKELGYDEYEVDIQDIFVSFVPEGQDILSYMQDIEGKRIETIAYRKNNTCFKAMIRASRIDTDENYTIFSVLNMQYEEYAKKELEKIQNNTKESMKARNEFVANITHELRTPVNGIKGHIKNLYSEIDDPDKKRTLDVVIKCCENMEKIISNFLDFSKIEAGKFDIEEAAFDFRGCINHVIDTSMSIANEKGLKLSAYVAEDIPKTVIGDELRIIQILNNLVSNALKFTSIGYVNIEVYKTRLKHGRMELTFFVIDTGIGVTLEEKEKMFKSFSQVDGSITRRFGGTGLGLFVTRQLVELMHGSISLESEKGKGSTFTFTIEVGVEGEEAEQEQTAPMNTPVLKTDAVGLPQVESIEKVYIYGSDANLKEVQNTFEKLLLCIEMDNWEKAEFFADNLKKLTSEAEQEMKSKVFKMVMAVRKEDYEKSIEQLRQIKEMMEV